MRWMIVLNVLLLPFLNISMAVAANRLPLLKGAHAGLTCDSCHGTEVIGTSSPSSASSRAKGCTGCHQGYDQIFDQAMTTRLAEKKFVTQSIGHYDPDFFAKNCNGCHVSDCLDCHGGDGHQISRPTQEECLACHKGYFVGQEYLGMAPREDHPRYQRGSKHFGETSLKMRPDIHFERGLQCMDCHSMQSLIDGKKAAKECDKCHNPNPLIIEHKILAHMQKMECYACHSAWASQEYGTFYLRLGPNEEKTANKFKASLPLAGDYLVRTYLRKQDAPPLGINKRDRISPIRPQFIAYYSDLRKGQETKVENRLLSAQWKAFFPHTVRRGTVMCDNCHDNRRRYLLEKEEDRIYRIDLDGMGLRSFWNQEDQTITNGSFVNPQLYFKINEKTVDYTKAYVKKWKNLIKGVESSSKE